ncbi:MAG: hypothetical protein ACK415_12565, partial [Thermodesulfovibrionales bacterium]
YAPPFIDILLVTFYIIIVSFLGSRSGGQLMRIGFIGRGSLGMTMAKRLLSEDVSLTRSYPLRCCDRYCGCERLMVKACKPLH